MQVIPAPERGLESGLDRQGYPAVNPEYPVLSLRVAIQSLYCLALEG